MRGRQGGKTTEMIRRAEAEFAYIVCPDKRQADWVARKAREMGADIPYPITWENFVRGDYYGRGIKGFVIDNLDLCIQSMTAVPVMAVSWTEEEVRQPQ